MKRTHVFTLAVAGGVVVLVAVGIIALLSIFNTKVKNSNRQSEVFACELYNKKTVSGITKLVDQLRLSTATSKQRTPAQKAVTEAAYRAALADFPLEDCTTNPISLADPPTATSVPAKP